jgi:hypothetical protein
MAEAWTIHLGPWWWFSRAGFAPGTETIWSWVIPSEWSWDLGILSATAHTHRGFRPVGRLAVTMIESQHFSDGSLHIHIHVRNTGFETIYAYRLFVSVVRPASLQPS